MDKNNVEASTMKAKKSKQGMLLKSSSCVISGGKLWWKRQKILRKKSLRSIEGGNEAGTKTPSITAERLIKKVDKTYRPSVGENDALLEGEIDAVFSKDQVRDKVASDAEFGERFQNRYIRQTWAIRGTQETGR